mmetsp:Transcript_64157/g.128972  ORF Transcript_64157/g.128972 Transcript_64157/m.128972 type:complete len:202 (-) Transcript_64157:96-701(-)
MLAFLVKLAGISLLTGSSINILQCGIPLLLPAPLNEDFNAMAGGLNGLEGKSRVELVRLWHSLPAPPEGVSGFHKGTILHAGPLHPISRVITHRLFGPGLWQGKELGPKDKGLNIFKCRSSLTCHEAKPFGQSWQKSALDRRPCLVLDYSRGQGNRFPWCGMRDEVRQLSPGTLLGLGSMKAFGGPLNSAVFVLEKKRGRR